MSETTKPKTSIQLGQLMVDSGLITPAQLEGCLRLAEQTSMPLGRVLIMCGNTSEHVLQAAVQAQSLLKDGLLDLDSAIQALQTVSQKSIPLEDALKTLGWQSDNSLRANKLGELLLESGIVSSEVLDSALSGSFATGLPLGRFLVLLGAISESLLAVALNAQIMIRDGKVSRDKAVEGLKAARLRLEVPLMEKSLYRMPARHTIRLGELFVLAGILSETHLMNALEMGLVTQKPIGQILMELGLCHEKSLNAALKLQQAVSEGRLRPLQASSALAKVHNSDLSLADAIAQLRPELVPREELQMVSLASFLKLVGTVTDDDIEKAVQVGLENSQILGRMLLVAGVIDEPTLQAAMRLDALVRAKLVTLEQACYAFNYSQQRLLNVDEALHEIGWTGQIANQIRNGDEAQEPETDLSEHSV
jgi:hypothetical protein